MEKTKLSSKGQVIIPKAVRDKKGWQAGEELIVEDRPDGVLLKRQSPFKPTTLDEVIGIAGYKGPPKTIEDMNAAVDEMFRREWTMDGTKRSSKPIRKTRKPARRRADAKAR